MPLPLIREKVANTEADLAQQELNRYISNQAQSISPTTFINALPPNAQSVVALGVLIISKSGQERCIDILVVNDRVGTLTAAIQQHFPGWGLVESWDIKGGVA